MLEVDYVVEVSRRKTDPTWWKFSRLLSFVSKYTTTETTMSHWSSAVEKRRTYLCCSKHLHGLKWYPGTGDYSFVCQFFTGLKVCSPNAAKKTETTMSHWSSAAEKRRTYLCCSKHLHGLKWYPGTGDYSFVCQFFTGLKVCSPNAAKKTETTMSHWSSAAEKRRTYLCCSKHLHGVKWNPGTHDYSFVCQCFTGLEGCTPNAAFYAEGEDKCK